MVQMRNVLVVCVDRDNDLGRKANVRGPVVGRKANLNAAAKLAIADPEDSDVNSIFAAVKKYDEAKGQFDNVEVVTLTGYGKHGLESDREINAQLDVVLDKFPADAFVLVSDGAEDDQIIPILQSRALILSKEMVIVKQAKEVESTFYTIKEALKDPYLAFMAFGIPGVILLLVAAMPTIGLQVAGGALGAFLLVYGLGIYDRAISLVRSATEIISIQRISFPLYLAVIFLLAFGAYAAYYSYALSAVTDPLIAVSDAASQAVGFSAIAGLFFIFGRSIDAIHFKKAFYLRKYFLATVFVLLSWFIIETAKNVLAGVADLTFFLFSIMLSFAAALVAFRVSAVLDVRNKVTKLLVGLPVYSAAGRWVGKVESVEREKNLIEYRDIKTKKAVQLKRKEFMFRKGRIMLAGSAA